jgi:L-fuconolactonase
VLKLSGPTQEWLDLVIEEIVDPERPIIDPHHHLWTATDGRRLGFGDYLLKQLWDDTGSGHNIVKTVFLECRAGYRKDGPEQFRPVGETEFVATLALQSSEVGEGRAEIAAIVSHADLTLGAEVAEVLAAHEEAGKGFFRGIRHSGASEPNPEALSIRPRYSHVPGGGGLYNRKDFQEGVRTLGRYGYTFEAWHYHHQLGDFRGLAAAAPETTIILDHLGVPLGVGPYAGRRDEIFATWGTDLAALAELPNVYVKLGGMAMRDNGFGWHDDPRPPTSDEFAFAQRRYYLHAIEMFGPERCMFESNFPVDKVSISYPVLWNGIKKIAAPFSEDEKNAMFYGTAANLYRI